MSATSENKSRKSSHHSEYMAPPSHPLMSMQHAPRSHLVDLFHCFDADNSGFLSPEELVSLSFALGLETTKERIIEDFKEADANQDGKISKAEFLSWFKLGSLGIGNTGKMVQHHMKLMSCLEEIETSALEIKSRSEEGEEKTAEEPVNKRITEENKL